MNILFLTNNLEVTKPLYEWLCETGESVRVWDSPLTASLFQRELKDIEFVISYNYHHIIKRDVIDLFPNRIINLHISMLPWNRGCSPNIWSFINNTPKGVTIHNIDEGIDTGDILAQRQMFFEEEIETLASSYNKLHVAIQELFRENWDKIKQGDIVPRGQGSYHTKKELDDLMIGHSISWNENISSMIKRIREQ